MSFIGRILHFFFERSARGATYTELTQRLTDSQSDLATRLRQAGDTPRNRKQACHLIGIERWGQRRLRVALGEPFVRDEYDAYCPDSNLGMTALTQAFIETRAETVTLASALEQKQIPLTKQVVHNDAGELSVGAWLGYLNSHAVREGKQLS